MTPLQMNNNNVINAFQEGQVIAVMTLIEQGYIDYFDKSFKDSVYDALVNGLKMTTKNANYWIDFYKIVN